MPLTTSNSNNIHSATSPSSSLSTSKDGEEEGKIDVTTMPNAHHPHDDSLKVLPLDATDASTATSVVNKTNLSNDKDDSTVTSSGDSIVTEGDKATQSPMTVNLFDDTKIKPDNQMVTSADDEKRNHSDEMMMTSTTGSALLQGGGGERKEGRAINFPLEILSNNQNSTGDRKQQQINFVPSTTEKTHVISFFDLSDVSMDGSNSSGSDDDDDENIKGKKKATAAVVGKDKIEKIDGEKRIECSFNGTIYKVL